MNSQPPSLSFQRHFSTKLGTPMVKKHARRLEIGPTQIWKAMKLPEEKNPKMAENTCAKVAGQN